MRTQATSKHVTESLQLFGMSSNVSTQKESVSWTIDPLSNLLNLDNMRSAFISETTRFSSSSQRVLRSSIAALPNFPNLSVFNLTMQDYSDFALLSSPRDVRLIEAPLCLLLDIFARVLSTDEICRIKLKNNISGLQTIPEMFLFHFKSTRRSSCGTLRINPTIDKTKNKALLRAIPHLEETFFNYDWILSDTGISFISCVLSLISLSETNYLKMVPYSYNTIPPLESGNSTTLTGMFLSYIDQTFVKISLLAGNTIDLTSKTLGLMVFINAVNQPVYKKEDELLDFQGSPTFELNVDEQFYSTVIVSSYCDYLCDVSPNNESVPEKRKHSKRKLAKGFYTSNPSTEDIKPDSESFSQDNSSRGYKQKE